LSSYAFLRLKNFPAGSEQSEVAASRPALHIERIDFHPESLMETYGTLPDGREVRIFTLENRNGLRARVTEYGAILVSLEAPDRDGKLADVTLGYDSLAGWLTNNSYLGATVGRFGNRICDGKFTLDGKEYSLATSASTRFFGKASRTATRSSSPTFRPPARKVIRARSRPA
jgi:hypothetical protein